MTGSSDDDASWQPHIRNKARREEIAVRFKNPKDPLKVVIVRDMWLTGFDAPSLHTMYVDKPMRGHGLMQAIARVNRVFRRNVTIDWTIKESVRAKLRVMVKRVLLRYDYPPGKQAKAIKTVLEQAEALCVDWAA